MALRASGRLMVMISVRPRRSVRTSSARLPSRPVKTTPDPQISNDIQRLKLGEDKVIAHEQAHKSAGGQYCGAAAYQFTTGPDGKRYIVGGEVPIRAPEGDTPQATMQIMSIVKRAALAPVDPSAQDLSVASQATAKLQTAKIELNKQMAAARKKMPAQQFDQTV